MGAFLPPSMDSVPLPAATHNAPVEDLALPAGAANAPLEDLSLPAEVPLPPGYAGVPDDVWAGGTASGGAGTTGVLPAALVSVGELPQPGEAGVLVPEKEVTPPAQSIVPILPHEEE